MHLSFRRWALSIGVALLATGYGAISSPIVAARIAVRQAQSPIAPLSPWFLALPASALPHGAVEQGARAGNTAADRASGLHTASFGALGRLDGYLEHVRWRLHDGGNVATDLSLGYAVSIFASADPASAAHADAVASLWENGQPLAVPGSPRLHFLLRASHHRQRMEVVAQDGPVEVELSLLLPRLPTAGAEQKAIAQLDRVAGAALRVVHRQVVMLPLALRTTGVATTEVEPAPFGAGPVVKSPSLMAVDWPQSPPGASLDHGGYRNGTRPQIAAASSAVRDLMPVGSAGRYARTAGLGRRGALYDSAAVFLSPERAHQALHAVAPRLERGKWLHPMGLNPYPRLLSRLPLADEVFGWAGGGETLLAVRQENVLLTIDAVGLQPGAIEGLADRLLATVPGWLSARGTRIIDAFGQPVALNGLNWYGFDQQDSVVGGLDYRSFTDILLAIKQMGYNSIRLPFSNQVVEQNPVVTSHVRANPDLQGLHALEIMDRIIRFAGALGLSVILDDHRSEAGWSSEANGLWYTDTYPDSAFVRDWTMLAARYADTNVVVGADLRNEPHGAASWGDGKVATDWHLAAERAGDAVLATNPNLLIIVEGIQYSHDGSSYWWGGNLQGVANAPISLLFKDGTSARSRLVYSAHDYGKDNCGIGCPWFNAATTYDSLAQVWNQYWGYVATDPSKPYAAPVWVGEFGTCNDRVRCVSDSTAGSQGQWFASLARYLAEHNIGWAYWSANGTQSTAGTRVYGDLDWYGLFTPDWRSTQPQLSAMLQMLRSETIAGSPGGPS